MSRTRKDTLKSYRRARGGRTLPRSGGGVHRGPTRKHLQEEAEMEDWKLDLDNWLQREPDEAIECPDCEGKGKVPATSISGHGYPDPLGLENATCPLCGGEGWVYEQNVKDRDYERAEAERADEWRYDGEY